MNPNQRMDYAQSVWSTFLVKSGRPVRMMGAGEWWILCKWMDDNIPLRTVLRAFEDTPAKPSMLVYFDKPVRVAEARRREAMIS